jgi:CRISPR-associated protein Cmr2
MGSGATTSAGIAIAHHRQPLLQVLEAVRQMEKRAKTTLGRSAFSVATLKRSGERNEAGGPWCVDRMRDTVPFLLNIVSLFRLGELSPRVLNQLRTESTGFALLPPRAWEQRIRFMLQRPMSDKAKAEAHTIASGARALIEAYGTKKSKSFDPWSETIGLLSLASFVARHSGSEEQ